MWRPARDPQRRTSSRLDLLIWNPSRVGRLAAYSNCTSRLLNRRAAPLLSQSAMWPLQIYRHEKPKPPAIPSYTGLQWQIIDCQRIEPHADLFAGHDIGDAAPARRTAGREHQLPRTHREPPRLRNHCTAISSMTVTKAERMPGSVAE
jgi:hypothetical protein